MTRYYAHSLEGKPPDEWHLLEEHLKGTAELARSFAAEFGCGEWGGWRDCGMMWGNIGDNESTFIMKDIL